MYQLTVKDVYFNNDVFPNDFYSAAERAAKAGYMWLAWNGRIYELKVRPSAHGTIFVDAERTNYLVENLRQI